MKKRITKILCLVSMAMGISLNASADTEKAITFEQLPAQAQQIIKSNFTEKKLALVKVETDLMGKDYDVVFTDGTKIEFDGNGKWTNIDCNFSAVPSALVPEAILTKVKELYPDATVNEIEREKRGFDVKLSNGMELKFDSNLLLYKMEYD